MAKVSLTDNNTVSPIPVGSGNFLLHPFNIAVTDTNPPTTPETLTITLAGALPGTLTDTVAGAMSNPTTFTAAATANGVTLQQILNGLTYTAAAIPDGTVNQITATVNETDASGNANTLVYKINEIGAPQITNIGGATQLASSPTPLFPIINAADADGSNQITAVLTIKNNGSLTNADGAFSSGGGLTPVAGVNGTYSIGPTTIANLNTILQKLVFQPSPVAPGASITDTIGLTVLDGTSGLQTTKTETVVSQGAPLPNTSPVVSHTHSSNAAINTPILAFNGVTITDSNPNPKDSATFDVTGGGTLTGNNLVASATPGTYTIAAETPTQLQSDIDGLTFNPPALSAGQSSATSSIALTVTNVNNGLSAMDKGTMITEGATTTPNPMPGPQPGPSSSGGTTPDVVAVTAASLHISLTDPSIGEAYRLYQAALNRVPDQNGLTFWTDQLLNGAQPITLAQDFMTSPEFMAHFGNLSVTDFVTTLYNNVLHRAPDAAGDSFWVSMLNAGTPKANVLLDFSDSPENRANTSLATHTS